MFPIVSKTVGGIHYPKQVFYVALNSLRTAIMQVQRTAKHHTLYFFIHYCVIFLFAIA